MTILEDITIVQKIPLARIADVLCSAVDPGYEAISYWGEVRSKVEPKVWAFDQRPVYKTEEEALKNINVHYRHYYPLNEGGALIIRDNESDGAQYTLDLKAIKKGLQVMAEKYPERISEIINESDDNDTADCLIQCALFGEVVYG